MDTDGPGLEKPCSKDFNSDFNVRPSFRRLMSTDADNIFLAKMTYYLNL